MIEDIKNLPEESGIYKITSPTGRVYIGEATNLKIRCSYYLNPNRIKGQRAIYNSLVKHSPENHKLEIVELCNYDILLERERYYQEIYDSVENGLNCFLTSTESKKKVWSKETITKMSENQMGEKNSFFGKKHTKESLKKISEAQMGEKNHNYGVKNSDEYKRIQSISNSKTPLKVIDTKTGEIMFFNNSKECANALDAKPSNIRMCKNNYKLKRRYIITDVEKVAI